MNAAPDHDPLDHGAIDAIVNGRHGDPFAILGPHPEADGTRIRAMLPGADAVEIIGATGASLGSMQRIDDAGLFSAVVHPEGRLPFPGPDPWDDV